MLMFIPSFNRLALSFLFTLFSILKLEGQCDPEPPGGATCQEAPLVCLNGLCDATEDNVPDGSYNGWCGNMTAIHNPQYFQFIPTFPDVFFQITVGNCDGGQNQLQAALLDTCPWTGAGEVIDCNPGAPEGSTFTLSASGLIIGQIYYIVFDGSAGADCDYTIDVATGIFEPQLLNDLVDVTANPDGSYKLKANYHYSQILPKSLKMPKGLLARRGIQVAVVQLQLPAPYSHHLATPRAQVQPWVLLPAL